MDWTNLFGIWLMLVIVSLGIVSSNKKIEQLFPRLKWFMLVGFFLFASGFALMMNLRSGLLSF